MYVFILYIYKVKRQSKLEVWAPRLDNVATLALLKFQSTQRGYHTRNCVPLIGLMWIGEDTTHNLTETLETVQVSRDYMLDHQQGLNLNASHYKHSVVLRCWWILTGTDNRSQLEWSLMCFNRCRRAGVLSKSHMDLLISGVRPWPQYLGCTRFMMCFWLLLTHDQGPGAWCVHTFTLIVSTRQRNSPDKASKAVAVV